MRAFLIFLLLASTAFAITDCEVCQIISPIYGACSPELVALYANKTGLGPVEWKCLQESPFTSTDGATNETPMHTLEMMNKKIAGYSIYGNMVMQPSDNLIAWSYDYDGRSEDFKFCMEFNVTPLAVSSASFKIYAPFAMSKNGTRFGAANLYVNFSKDTPISNSQPTEYGYLVATSFISRNSTYRICGSMGKLDACVIICSDISDVYYADVSINQSSTLVGNNFSDGFRWRDRDGTCAALGCTGNYLYGNMGGPYTTIPLTSTGNINCNGVSCRTGTNPTKNTWYYKNIKCQGAISGKVIANQFGVVYSGELDYQCNATAPANTAPNITLVFPANNSNITSPSNFTFFFIDDNSTENCSLRINGTIWANNASTSNNTNTTFPYVSFNYTGNYTWLVNCSDGLTSNVSATRTFRVWLNNPINWGFGIVFIALILITMGQATQVMPLRVLLTLTGLFVLFGELALLAFQAREEYPTLANFIWQLEIIPATLIIFFILMVCILLFEVAYARKNDNNEGQP